MKQHIAFTIAVFLLIASSSIAQDTIEFAIFIDDSNQPVSLVENSGEYEVTFEDEAINLIFENYTITKFERTYPNSRFSVLHKVWSIQANSVDLMDDLIDEDPELFKSSLLIEEPLSTYTPNDYTNIYTSRPELDLINVRGAWDISKGDTTIIIGVTDSEFDVNHEDLTNQINKVWSNTTLAQVHGTPVASVLGAEVNNNKGLTGIGHDCRLDLSVIRSANEVKKLSDSGAYVVNCSWLNSGCSRVLWREILYNEVYENGTVACFGAGNGIHLDGMGKVYRDDCYTTNTGPYPPAYPHNIATTSIGSDHTRGTTNNHWLYGMTQWGWNDVHWHIYGEYDTVKVYNPTPQYSQYPVGYTFPKEMHNHYEDVDIAAPGYAIRVFTPGSNNYYGGAKGTSFASPMTAGTAGLMFSTNPCLTPYQIEYGIKTTAANIDTIPENIPYAGKLGAGRLDAEAAVSWASTFNCNSNTATTMYVYQGDRDQYYLPTRAK